MINVLYVDDELNNLKSFKAAFRRFFHIYTALSAEKAETIISKNEIHVLITDQRMPIKLGTELLTDSVKKYPEQARILLTAYADIKCLEQAINKGHVFRYFEKPWDADLLKVAIEEGYDMFILERKRKILKETLKQMTLEELQLLLQKKELNGVKS
jgi:response regulator RpfG family c-di-GMP phosphodiesterase